MKRLFSFMMALVLVLSLSVTVFAAEDTGSITITNATVDKEYSVFKIFSATVKDGHTTYSIEPDDPFFADLFGEDGTDENDYFVYHESTDVITAKNDLTDEDIKKELIKALTDLVKGKTPAADPITAQDDTVTFTGLDYGYYVITSTLGAAVTINEVKPAVEVIDKNQKTTELDKKIWDEDYVNEDDTVGKWVETSSANVGDTVNFKVEFTATNYDGEKKIEKYTITDTLSSAWANINIDSIKVTVGGTELAGDAFTVTPVGNDVTTGFTLEIPWVNNDTDKTSKYDSTSDVVITYSATVLEAAASADPANKNNKNHVTSGWDSEGDQTTTKVYNLGFAKVDGTNGKPLSGAKFGLYSDENCTIPVNVTSVDGTQGVYMVGGTSNEVETYDDGQVVIQGLEAGTYYLKENTPPAGYNALAEAIAVVVSGDINNTEKIKDSYTVNNEKLDIENNTGMELPSTGGKGTMMLITIGSMVAMAFAILLITHKKMSVYHD